MVIIGRSSEDNGGWGGVFAIQIDRLARCRPHFGVRAACHRFQQRACPRRFQLSSTRRPDPPGNGKLPLGVWQKTPFALGSAIKPVLIFADAAYYRPIFNFEYVSRITIDRVFNSHFKAALAEAKVRGIK